MALCSVIRNDSNEITRVLALNGQDSLLYSDILKEVPNPESALQIWAKAYTNKFKSSFGDWELYQRVYTNDPSNGYILDPLAYIAPKLDINKEPKVQYVLDSMENPNEVNYSLKFLELLQSEKSKQIFNKGLKNKWSIDKILQELGISKNEKSLVLKSYKEGNTNLNDLIIDLISKYSYGVRINNFSESKESDYSDKNVPGGVDYSEEELIISGIIPNANSHVNAGINNSIGWFRNDIEENDPSIRRIIEIQSDLFQKVKILDKLSNDPIANDFLNILSSDNKWLTFFIKSIIQDSIKKEYSKIRIPLGNTTSKIQGHQTIEDRVRFKQNQIDNINKQFETNVFKNDISSFREFNGKYYWDSSPVSKEVYDNSVNTIKEELNTQKQQLEKDIIDIKNAVPGSGNSIFTLYENTITNILNKQYGKDNVLKVTDEYGNTWNELTLDKNRDLSNILLNLKPRFTTNNANIENVLFNLSRFTSITDQGTQIQRNVLSKVNNRYFITNTTPAYNPFNSKNTNAAEFNLNRFKKILSAWNISESNFEIRTIKDPGSNNKYEVLINPNQVTFDAIQPNFINQKIDTILSTFGEKFGISNKIKNITKAEFARQFPEQPSNANSAIVNGNLYLFKDATAEVVTEEVLHYFVFTIQQYNPKLFNKLVEETFENFPILVQEVKALYTSVLKDSPNLNAQLRNEVVTKALVRHYIDVANNEEVTTSSYLKEFGKWLKDIIGEILDYFGFKKISATDLGQLNDLNSLAKLLNTDIRIEVDDNINFDLYSFREEFRTVREKLPLLYARENILSNKKTFTLRDVNYFAGEDYVDIIEGNRFLISNKGKVNLNEAVKLTGKTKEQLLNDFIGSEEFVDINPKVKAWFEGKGRLIFYDISRYTPSDVLDINLDGNQRDSRFQEEINKIEQVISNLRKRLKRAETPERRQLIRDNIKRLQNQIDSYQEDDSNNINKIINQLKITYEDFIKNMDKYKSDPRQIDAEFIKNTINGWNNFLGQFKITDPKQKEDINTYLEGLIKIHEELQQQLFVNLNASAEVELGESFLNGGEITWSKDISTRGRDFQSAIDNQYNKLIQWVSLKIKEARAKAQKITSSYQIRSEDTIKDFLSYQKSQNVNSTNLYDMFLQTKKEGDKEVRTGYYIIKESLDYQEALRGLSTEAEKWAFLARTNSITYNNDVYDQIIKNVEDYQRNVGFDINNPYDLKSAELYATKNGTDISNLKLNPGDQDYEVLLQAKIDNQITRIKSILNPITFGEVVNKLKNNIKLTKSEKKWFNEFIDKRKNFYIDYRSYNLRKGLYTMELTDSNYIDKKWEEINNLSENDPRKKFYELFIREINSIRNKLYGEDVNVPKNYIPSFYPMEKLETEDNKEYWKRRIRDKWVDTLSERLEDNIQGIDPITGDIIKRIPFYSLIYTDPTEKSYDLTNVLSQFVGEYADYITKSEIEDNVLLIKEIVKKQKVYMQDSKGNPIVINGINQAKNETSNNYLQLENYINASLYGDHYDKEGTVGNKTLLSTFDKRKKDEFEKLLKDSIIPEDRKKELYNHYITKPEIILDNTLLTDDEIEYIVAGRQYQLINKGQHMTWKKVINGLNKYTALKVLGFSPLSALYEAMQGTGALWTEAASGKHFNDNHAAFSFKYYINSLKPGKEKVFLDRLSKLYGVTGDFSQEIQPGGIGKKAFWFMSGARKLINSQFLISILKARIIKIEDKELSLLDLIDFNGNGEAIVKDEYKNNYTQEQLNKDVLDTQILYGEIVNQNRDRNSNTDQILFNRKALNRSIGMFKFSWMIQGLNKRFAAENENIITGKRKGFYRSGFGLFLSQYETSDIYGNTSTESRFTPLKGLQRLLSYTLLGNKLVSKDGKAFDDINLSDLDQENIKRFVREMSIIFTALALKLLMVGIRPGGDEPDEDDRKSLTYKSNIFLTNMFIRNYRDFTMYIDVDSWRTTVKNAIPLTQTAADMLNIPSAVFDTIGGDPYSYENTTKEQLKIPKTLIKATPIINQIPNTWRKFNEQAKSFNF